MICIEGETNDSNYKRGNGMVKIDAALFEKAYKKLKSSVYFDKTQAILRDEIVEFESQIEDLEDYFKELCERFLDEEEREDLFQEIWDSICIDAFPKKLVPERAHDIITNSVSSDIKIEEKQYFINMCVKGHILGVLWLMLIGYRIDKQIYKHSFGNRIRKKLLNELSEEPTYSPYLFEPYFEQYESWRDSALDKASKNLDMGHDVVILTMDFRRFFYSVDMDEDAFKQIYKDAGISEDENQKLLKSLNYFLMKVVDNYAENFEEDEFGKRRILPIGLLPSNVIANWCLRNFDKAVVDGWNPVYFGRYVDDIIIVDKIPYNSDAFKLAKKNNLTKDEIIDFFLKQCSRWNGIGNIECKNKEGLALFSSFENQNEQKGKDYILNRRYNPIKDDESEIIIQNEKLKIFYFKSGQTDALITCFKEKIGKNKSEFRHMPEDEAVFQKDTYNEIYKLHNSATINKFGGIKSISVDKFNLSKYLGKHLRIGGMIEDRVESKFEEDILKIFDIRTLIENYTTWEKVLETFIINERFSAAKKFIEKIIEAINSLEEEENEYISVKYSLCLYLHSCICRSFALVWKKNSSKTVQKIYNKMPFEMQIYFENEIEKERYNYCKTRMVDKSVLPIPIDMILNGRKMSDKNDINFTRFYEVIKIAANNWNDEYKFYPYLITMYDFSMISCIEQFKSKTKTPFKDLGVIYEKQERNYLYSNYNLDKEDSSYSKTGKVSVKVIEFQRDSFFHIAVGNERKKKLRIAIANAKLNHDNFEKLIKDKPNRSYARYKDLSSLVNQAIDGKADMLVMPEAFVPFEWLTTLARTCARNNLALITGIEHVKIKKKVFNLTAVIMPYEDCNHKSAYLSFHLKKHYAPSEQEEIRGYRLTEVNGNTYELYQWNGCYFPVYCCYELTSIYDRALFQAYADFLVAIEWNRDVNYYSNILESLSRDIHCYCIQVNSSDYGDSRITQPSRTEEKDIIRTKGGKNNTILIDEIDIEKLREFQFKEYTLQKKYKGFKITPPEFDKDIIGKKIRGENIFE